MSEAPFIEITGDGPHLRMWVAVRHVGCRVKRYGGHEPTLVPVCARQWVCDCGARGTLVTIQRVGMTSTMASAWVRHARKHCTTRSQAMTLHSIMLTGRWPDAEGWKQRLSQTDYLAWVDDHQ
jgi:hypothetical protein